MPAGLGKIARTRTFLRLAKDSSRSIGRRQSQSVWSARQFFFVSLALDLQSTFAFHHLVSLQTRKRICKMLHSAPCEHAGLLLSHVLLFKSILRFCLLSAPSCLCGRFCSFRFPLPFSWRSSIAGEEVPKSSLTFLLLVDFDLFV